MFSIVFRFADFPDRAAATEETRLGQLLRPDRGMSMHHTAFRQSLPCQDVLPMPCVGMPLGSGLGSRMLAPLALVRPYKQASTQGYLDGGLTKVIPTLRTSENDLRALENDLRASENDLRSPGQGIKLSLC